MADGTYFVGRNELLSWINSTLSLGLTKIEQTASGAVACQLMDALHPGSVNLSKVDFNSRSEYDSINNYKALQAAFARAGVDKPVDVARLVKARPLDNIEFMQWFKSYWDSRTGGGGDNVSIGGYDARARRATSKTGDVRGGVGGGGGGGASCSSHSSEAAAAAGTTAGTANIATSAAAAAAAAASRGGGGGGAPLHSSGASFSSRDNVAAAGGGAGGAAAAARSLTPKAAAGAAAAGGGHRRQRTTTAATTTTAPSTNTTTTANTSATTTIAELTSSLAEARLRAAAAERERDFYFDKLRDIELLCGAPDLLEDEEGRPIAAAEAALKLVERVLFAADEAGAKEVLAEVGVVVATGATPPPLPSDAAAAGGGQEAVATRQ